MAQQTIGLGSAPNDGTGDNLRIAGDKINDNFTELYARTNVITATVNVSSAEILNINSSPKILITAPGASKIINVISIQLFFDYNSIAYATNTSLYVSYNSSGADLNSSGISIANTFDFYRGVLLDAINTTYSSAVRVNTPLVLYASGGNPTNGNSTMKVYVTYNIIDI